MKPGLSKGFRPFDMAGIPHAVKGFDKIDFCEVSSNLYKIVIRFYLFGAAGTFLAGAMFAATALAAYLTARKHPAFTAPASLNARL